MTPEDYAKMERNFLISVELVQLDAGKATGLEWIVVPRTGANRTIKEQHGLFIQAHDGIDNDRDGLVDEPDERVTKADGGQSPHNFDLARDLVPLKKPGVIWWDAPPPVWHRMGQIAELHGLVWGGHFKSLYDAPHVEARNWRDAKAAWLKGEIQVA